jgi:HAD superfamily hydrolase (TIGR01459 family)
LSQPPPGGLSEDRTDPDMVQEQIDQPIRLTGLSAIADRFDGVILDQWGVLHDGAKAPPGAIEAVNAMAQAGKRMVILSNSARFGSDARDRLIKLGYDPTIFLGTVTSGEAVHDMLRDRRDPFFAALGRSVLLIARDDTLIAGLDYRQAETVETADFILLGSSTAPEKSLAADYADMLDRAVARGLPLICANPDRVGVISVGFIEGPGLLAAYYEKAGGTVRYLGKPHAEVYGRATALLDLPMDRVIAVGDSLEHDIAGGLRVGCLTALVEAGIHAADLPDGLGRLCGHYSATPDFVIPRLLW